MSERTGIQWCDHTFNIAWGCFKVSPGCKHCYAETLAVRFGFDVWGPPASSERRVFGPKHWADPLKWNRAAERAGVRAKVFCSSMADVFEDHPTIDAEREKLWPLIRATPWLRWQLLTKRPERLEETLPADWGNHGYPNVWLGASIESMDYIERVRDLLRVPAAVHWLSCEPLLGPLDLRAEIRGGIRWVVIGGESGHGARPFDLGWARSLVQQSMNYGASPFVKQLGACPVEDHESEPRWLSLRDSHGGDMAEWSEDLRVREFPWEDR